MNAPLTLASPQLNPLPDFQRLSFGGSATPRGEEPPSTAQLAPPVGSRSPVIPDTPVPGYQSNTPALSPPQQGGWDTNRTSLAYLGEAPSSDGGHADIEAREAQQAFEDEAKAKDSENGHERRNGEFGQDAAPSRLYADSSLGKRDEGLATISEAMLETSPPVSQPSTFPIPSPDVPSDVQPQSSIDSSIHETGREGEDSSKTSSQPREYQPLRDSMLPPPPRPSSVPETSVEPPTPTPAETSTPRSPTSPTFAPPPAPAPLPIPSPLHVPVPNNQAIPHFVPPPSGFEPRPLTPRSMSGAPRQPISIKPQTATSLGSRHGDIVVAGHTPTTPQFVPAAPSPNLRGDATPSGYFTPSSTMGATTPTGENGKRTISAGAFRRPAGGTGAINVNGGRSFAPSGYNVTGAPGSPGFGPGPDAGPSDAEQIAQSWRSTAVPVAPSPAPVYGGGGSLDDVPTPSFDTRPLQVNKNRMSMGGLPRPGTVP